MANNCIINVDRNTGKIVSVNTLDNKPSKLFEAAVGIPFAETASEMAKIVDNAYTDEIKSMYEGSSKYKYDTGEPMLFTKDSKGKVYSTFEEAIKRGDTSVFSVGFLNPNTDEFIKIKSYRTDDTELGKHLTNLIKEAILSPNRVFENGNAYYKGEGQYPETRKASAVLVNFNTMLDSPMTSVEMLNDGDGTLDIKIPSGMSFAISGTDVKVVRLKDSPKDLKDYDNFVDLSAAHAIYKNGLRPVVNSANKNVKKEDEALVSALRNFLKDMGFEESVLSKYFEKHGIKYGKIPSVSALADMAEKIVAIADGQDYTDDLTEEVAHIALEALAEKNSLVEILASIHLTDEYKENYETYRELYSKLPQYQNEADLQDAIRMEVAGKVLAKAIRAKFNTQEVVPEEASIFDKLRQLWDRFVAFFRSQSKPYQSSELIRLNQRIADSIINQNLGLFNQNFYSDRIFYSAATKGSKKIEDELKGVRSTLDNIFNNILKTNTPNKAELDKIVDNMTEHNIISSINEINATAQMLLNQIKENVDSALQKGELIPVQDINLFTAVKENIIPTIENLRKKIDPKVFNIGDTKVSNARNSLIESIDDTTKIVSRLNPSVVEDFSKQVDTIVDDVLSDTALTDKQKEELREITANGLKDVSFWAKNLGLASQSNNMYIQLIHQKVAQMLSDTNVEVKVKGDEIIRRIFKKGLNKYAKNIIKRISGRGTAYFLSPVNQALFDEDILNLKATTISQVTGKDIAKIKDSLSKGATTSSLFENEAQAVEFTKKFREGKKLITEQVRKPEYYAEREARFAKADVSEATKETLASISSDRAALYGRIRRSDGTINRQDLTKSEKLVEISIQKRHKMYKSVYDQTGQIKEGIRLVKKSDLSPAELQEVTRGKFTIPSEYDGYIVTTLPGVKKEDLDDSSRTTLDMNMLSLLYLSEISGKERSRNASSKFIQQIEVLEDTNQDAFDWLRANASMTLSQEFYDSIGQGNKYVDKVQEYIDSITDADEKQIKQNLLDEYKETQTTKLNLLKQNRSQRNPLEIEAQHMPALTKKAIIDLESNLYDIRIDIGLELEEDEDTIVKEDNFDKTVNEAFKKDLIESGMSEYDFALSHMTGNNKSKVQTFKQSVEKLLKGRTTKIRGSFSDFISKSNIDPQLLADMNSTDRAVKREAIDLIVKQLSTEFAKENLASYYTRFEPKGYSEMISKFESGEFKTSDLFNDLEGLKAKSDVIKYLEITPDYSWLEDIDNQESVNKNYMQDGLSTQPKLSKYVDQEFFDKYGIDMKKWLENPTMDLNKLTATRNTEEFEMLRESVNLNKDTIKNYGNSRDVSAFQRPQISKSLLEDVITFDYKDTIRNIIKTRVDDKDYGEVLGGIASSDLGVRVVPKYFQNKLEDLNNLTENTVEAILLNYKQSVLYKNRTQAEKSFKAFEWAITNQKFKENGKLGSKFQKTVPGQTSEYLKMAKEYIDHHLYGVKQTRNMHFSIFGKEVDLTRLISQMQGFVRFSNLGFNFYVDAVSATTGVLNNFSDRIADDYFHKSSINRAMKQSIGMMGNYLTESGGINKKSALNHLTEYFSLQDFDSKIKNSSYSRATRFLTNSAYKTSKLANVPVGPRTLLAILNDYRYIDGNFVNWETFLARRKQENSKYTTKQLEAEWVKYEKDSLFDNIEITEKGIKYNSKFLSKFEAEGQAKEAFKKLTQKVSVKAKTLAQLNDGTLNELDQVAAQRDVLTNVFMMHSGWLPILLTRRFKGKQFNISTGRIEEGHFVTLFDILYKSVVAKRRGESVKELILNLEPYQRKNLKRFIGESLIWSAILMLGSAILGADDDDDSYIEDLFQYIYIRTASEFSTQQLPGIPSALIDKLKNPIVPMRTIEMLEPISFLSKTYDDIVTFGDGNGSEIYKALKKNTILKRYDQYNDVQSQLDSYRYFNDKTLFNLGSVGKPKE